MLSCTSIFLKYFSSTGNSISSQLRLQAIFLSDFMKISRECTKEPYSFVTIDTTLSPTDPLKFRKNLFGTLEKMTVTDQINFKQKNYAK